MNDLSLPPLVYDCFLFFNELDLLEIRLNELKDVVDKFVLVECSTTFSSKEKPFFFEENKHRFNDFLHKIIHVKVYDTPALPNKVGRMGSFHNRHDVEIYQRNCISRGLTDCKPDDIILISDADEIPSANSVLQAKNILKENCKVSFKQKLYYYYLNGLCVSKNREIEELYTTSCLFKEFTTANNVRLNRRNCKYIIDKAGWQFSYLGGVEKIFYKIESFAHAEWDNDIIKNRDRLKNAVENGIDLFGRHEKQKQMYVEVDSTFPLYVLNNIEKFQHLIKK